MSLSLVGRHLDGFFLQKGAAFSFISGNLFSVRPLTFFWVSFLVTWVVSSVVGVVICSHRYSLVI